jgi:hypothetical protein
MNTSDSRLDEPGDEQQTKRLELGTLPETIGEADLDKLDLALGFLFSRLREARMQFQGGIDNGRPAAFTALGALWNFIALFDRPYLEALQIPIVRLQDALVMLDDNRVEPILQPVPHSGRAPSSHSYAALKGHAAATVQRLLLTDLDRADAHEEVAKQLVQLGVRAERGSGVITATTVRNWVDEVSSDVGRRGTAAIMYDSMLTTQELHRFTALSKEAGRLLASQSLATWVGRHFPDLQKPT